MKAKMDNATATINSNTDSGLKKAKTPFIYIDS